MPHNLTGSFTLSVLAATLISEPNHFYELHACAVLLRKVCQLCAIQYFEVRKGEYR
jgi:hypothetical protein